MDDTTTARVRVILSFHSARDYTMACPGGEALFYANFTSLCRPGWLFVELPGRGLEPLRISPPDPKSGASANFATLACAFAGIS